MKIKAALDGYVVARDNFEEAEGTFLHAMRPVLVALGVEPLTAQVTVTREFVNVKYAYNSQGGEWKDGWYSLPRSLFDEPLPQCAALEWKKEDAKRKQAAYLANKRHEFNMLRDFLRENGEDV